MLMIVLYRSTLKVASNVVVSFNADKLRGQVHALYCPVQAPPRPYQPAIPLSIFDTLVFRTSDLRSTETVSSSSPFHQRWGLKILSLTR